MAKTTATTGGDRTVVLTNGTEYVTNLNEVFGIVSFGTKAQARRYFLRDASDAIKSVTRFGFHKLWAEIVEVL